MKRIFQYIVFLLLLLISLVYAENLQILEQSSNGIVIEWSLPDVSFQPVTTSLGEFSMPVCGDLSELFSPGKPVVPVYSLLLQNISPSQITILDTVYTIENCGEICPAPVLQINGDNAQEQYVKGPLYSRNAFYPASFTETRQAVQRRQTVTSLAVYPVQVNPVARESRVLRYIKFRINGNISADLPRNRMTGTTTGLVRRQLFKPAFDITPWWQDHAGAQLVRIKTPAEGIYRITGRQLADKGVSIQSIDPATIKLYHNGALEPIHLLGNGDNTLDIQDQFIFYGQRLDGDTTWFNAWSDTNVYWLTWGGDAGLFYEQKDAPTGQAPFLSAFTRKAHFEQDLEFYHGDSNQDIQNTFDTPGEGWVWSRSFYPGTHQGFSFDLPGLTYGELDADSVFIKLHLRGMTTDTADYDHHVRLTVNGTVVHDGYFNDREEWTPECSMPVSQLQVADNLIDIRSVDDTQANISQFYLDWFSARYPHTFSAENGWLYVDSLGQDNVSLSVDGLWSDSVYAWNLGADIALTLPQIMEGQYLNIQVLSAGYSDGNYARFFLDDTQAFEGSRGINMVIVNEQTGQVELARSFDTWASSQEADSLVAVINNIPTGRTVLCAVKDEGSNYIGEAQYAAIETLGSNRIRELGSRDSWALIGIKGAAPGSVVEMLSATENGPAHIQEKLVIQGDGNTFIAEFGIDAVTGPLVVFDSSVLQSPVIESIKIPDLLSTANQADYLIITHSAFMEQAARLADFRQVQNGFTTRIINIDDIYTVFSNGIKTPQAIKSFLQYTYENWQSPAPEFVLLFGDASWDPKNNAETSNKIDFLPSYGNPVSDIWYVCFDGPDDLLPDMSIGRLPVENLEQAEICVDKIMEYTSTPSAAWKKNFLFISGGFDYYEQYVFDEQSGRLSNDFITPPPVGGSVVRINKETQGLNEGEHRDDILNTINDGVLWTNFIGHAGSSTWDLMFHNPDVDLLQNGPRYPFITSMTCHTGRFAEPNQDSFGEKFLRVVDKGAIAFWGTAGWGYTYEDYLYLRQLYPVILQDSVRALGSALTHARTGLWNQLGNGQHVRNILLQYTLLGDPALELALPLKPDLAISETGIQVMPSVPSEMDSLADIQLHLFNYGLVPEDSVEISLTAARRGGENHVLTLDSTLAPVMLHDSLTIPWPLKNMAGLVDLTVQIDPRNVIDECDKDNNSAVKQVTVVSNIISLLHPFDNALLQAGETELTIRNPRVENIQDYVFEFQLDTVAAFKSQFLKSSGPVSPGIMVTRWNPGDLLAGVYYWRCRSTSEQDDTPVWVTGSFTLTDSPVYGWQQNSPYQIMQNSLVQIDSVSNRVQLAKQNLIFNVESAGMEDGNFARILVNSESLLETGRGINMVVLDVETDSVIFYRNFDTYADNASDDSLVAVIDRLPDSLYVLCAIKDEGRNQLNETAYQALEAIGSAYCRDLDYRDSWAIIGIKGAPVGSVLEGHASSGDGHVSLRKEIDVYLNSGTITSEVIGPATKWETLNVYAETPEGTGTSLDVIGISLSGEQKTIMQNLQGSTFDLSAINASVYPYLKFQENLTTLNHMVTPVFNGWSATLRPAPDIAVNVDGLETDSDSVLAGSVVSLSAKLYNLGRAVIPKDSLKVLFEYSDSDGEKMPITYTPVSVAIPPDSFFTVQNAWTISGRPGIKYVYISLDPDEKLIELDRANNYAATTVQVLPDTMKPRLKVTFDGEEIMYGDWVSSTPLIRIDVQDNSRQSLLDTSRINILMDDVRVPFGGAMNAIQVNEEIDTESALRVDYSPHLESGDHLLTVIMPDASGNTSYYQENFVVVEELALRNVVNYPNPFARNTEFTFQLSQPADVRIKIYTVAGRLIQVIAPGWLSAGFNHIPWNGLDADGDIPANGVYIYQIIATSGTEKTDVIEKCIIVK